MMETVCTEQHHLFNHKTLLDLDVPPRKLLHRRANLSIYLPNGGNKGEADQHQQLQQQEEEEEEEDGGGAVDTYSSDEFRMYDFKVRRCMRGRSHDWTDCPFAHPGEKARRRDPRRYHYSGTICPDFRRSGGNCPRGDDCEFAHGVFECWLHPARYRTMPCKDGRRCRRKVCFFAHSHRQLRVLPSSSSSSSASSPPILPQKPSCCLFLPSPAALSPTSTLMGFSSPPLSPPISPYYANTSKKSKKGFGARFPDGMMSYGELFGELLSRLEAMELSPAVTISASNNGEGLAGSINRDFGAQQNDSSSSSSSSSTCYAPDLEWVNELLM